MAAETSEAEALEYNAITEEWFEGLCCFEMVEVLILSH
jgi:hypothetical protein